MILNQSARATPLTSTTVLIGEVQTASGSDADLEFIELYNASIAPLSLDGYTLVYRSASGTSDLTVYTFKVTETLPARGHFLLVHTGKTIGVTPDAVFAQQLSGSGGGLAVKLGASVIDSVGWGSATNLYVEGSSAAAPPADQSLERLPGGDFGSDQDTDNNAADFQVLTTPTPQNTTSPAGSAIGFSIVKTAPASVSVSQTFTYTLVATNRISDTALSVIITDAVPLSATIASVSDGGVVQGHVVSWTIGSVLNAEAITRTIVVTAPTSAATLINTDYGVWASNYLTRTMGKAVTTQVTASGSGCSGAYTPIYTVQGSGLSSPLVGQSVTLEGAVVGDFQAATQQSGFYLQDPLGDGDPATSDGIFVYAATPAVALGDVVRVTGTVVEFNGLTEINPVTNVQWCNSGQPLAPSVLDLPVAATNDQERYEGMYVTIPETLTVDQNFFQGRYGQVTLSADGRMYNPTNGSGFGDTVELNARRMLVLDDGSTVQNPVPVPYLGVDGTLRAGDVITNLTGVIDYGAINSNSAIRHYRLQPIGPVTISRAHPRTASPEPVGGAIRVASFNVLNYFNGDGAGGGFPTSRGADTLAEFVRQRDKIIPAIIALNADVVGLMEIENDGAGSLSAIQDLVNGLNAAAGAGTFAFVTEPAPGSDAIKVALIYQPARVTPQGAALNYQTTHPDYDPLFDRPPLAQRFRAPNGQEFFVIVNHFKSKGSCPTSGVDTDQGDGQGCWNVKRTAQASGLLDWIATLQATDPDVIVIGDLNAYGAEDPINTLVAGGLINQALRVPAATRYSYVFDGQAGYLDQALTTSSLDPHITGVTYWHINADEPSVIDYDQDFNPPGLYTPTPYRASDHDPVLIGLDFGTVTPADFSGSIKLVNTPSITAGQWLTYTLIVSNSGDVTANFALTDTLHAALTVISAPGLTQTGSTLSASGSIGGQSTRAFSITARTLITFSGFITNVAALSGDGQVRSLTAPSVSVSALPADVSASFSASTATLKPGEVITFTFALTNSGGMSAHMWLTPTLDARYFTVSDALDFTPTLTWSGDLPGGESRSVRYAARVKALGQLPIGAALIDNAAQWAADARVPVTVTAPTTLYIYGVYLPLIND